MFVVLSLVFAQTDLRMKTASGLQVDKKADMFVFHILPLYTCVLPKHVREPLSFNVHLLGIEEYNISLSSHEVSTCPNVLLRCFVFRQGKVI